jgi:hypothetical protein
VKTITIAESVLRKLVNELFDGTAQDYALELTAEPAGGAKVNAVVDPSAAETDPMNPDYRPQNATELGVAMRTLTHDLPDEQASRVYDLVKQNLDDQRDKEKVPEATEEETPDMKSTDAITGTKTGTHSGTKTVESVVRAMIRKVLSEEWEGYDAVVNGSDDDDEPIVAPVDKGEDKLAALAQELGMEVSGAKQFVHKAEMRFKFLRQELPKGHPNSPGPRLGKDKNGKEYSDLNDMEVLILKAWADYIDLLKSTDDEITSADVQLMLDHPEVALELDGFRVFLKEYIEEALVPQNDKDNDGLPGDRRWLGVEPGKGKFVKGGDNSGYVAKDFDPNLNGPGKGGTRTKQNAPTYKGDYDWLENDDEIVAGSQKTYKGVKSRATKTLTKPENFPGETWEEV